MIAAGNNSYVLSSLFHSCLNIHLHFQHHLYEKLGSTYEALMRTLLITFTTAQPASLGGFNNGGAVMQNWADCNKRTHQFESGGFYSQATALIAGTCWGCTAGHLADCGHAHAAGLTARMC